jgi:hypothetical protein
MTADNLRLPLHRRLRLAAYYLARGIPRAVVAEFRQAGEILRLGGPQAAVTLAEKQAAVRKVFGKRAPPARCSSETVVLHLPGLTACLAAGTNRPITDRNEVLRRFRENPPPGVTLYEDRVLAELKAAEVEKCPN